MTLIYLYIQTRDNVDVNDMLNDTAFKELWELDKQNSMFTKLFID